ncbi:lachesin isoform X2 [Bemisia tabaci]|uniref:lachesin isoform X2 n=1 Tax=Bemisia tabaci TaxID=7038 RepID=UPI0008F9C363|nr:PREDICTED: lachesin isoform X2 [Bemisia tabaci]
MPPTMRVAPIPLRCILVCVLFALNVEFAAHGLEPEFSVSPKDVRVPQGRDAIFTCVVKDLGGYRVSANIAPARVAWIKADTKAILAIHDHVITNNARLSVTHNDFNTWTLNVSNVRPEDSGDYMCQVNTDPMKSQTASLEVVIPPDIIEGTAGDVMVREGGSTKLVCIASGYPAPNITWKREDGGDIILRSASSDIKHKTKTVHGSELSLTQVTRSDMGAYICIAANGFPPSVSKRIMLHIHFIPTIRVPNQLVGAPIGTNVTLQCYVEASPKSINYWIKESGEMIMPTTKYQPTEISNNPHYGVSMKLDVRRLNKNDLGGYKCISKNSFGGAEGSIRLYEVEVEGNKVSEEIRDNSIDGGSNVFNELHGSYPEPMNESDYARKQHRSPGAGASHTAPRTLLLALVLSYVVRWSTSAAW